MKKAILYLVLGIILDRTLFSLGMYYGVFLEDTSPLYTVAKYLTYYYP